MTLLEIEAFLAVVKYGTLSSAAQNLYITQPALTRRIQLMEEELGVSPVYTPERTPEGSVERPWGGILPHCLEMEAPVGGDKFNWSQQDAGTIVDRRR